MRRCRLEPFKHSTLNPKKSPKIILSTYTVQRRLRFVQFRASCAVTNESHLSVFSHITEVIVERLSAHGAYGSIYRGSPRASNWWLGASLLHSVLARLGARRLSAFHVISEVNNEISGIIHVTTNTINILL